jgi:hypothetical protein
VNGLEGTLVLRKPLDYESLPNFTLAIRAQVLTRKKSPVLIDLKIIPCVLKSIIFSFQDQGNPPKYSDTLLYVNVIDADDQNPRFLDERYTSILPDRAPAVRTYSFYFVIISYYKFLWQYDT